VFPKHPSGEPWNLPRHSAPLTLPSIDPVLNALRQRRSIEHGCRAIRLPDESQNGLASRISRKPGVDRPYFIRSRLPGEIPIEYLFWNWECRVVGDRHLTTKHATHSFLTSFFKKANFFLWRNRVPGQILDL
jgi:hypothetical protein